MAGHACQEGKARADYYFRQNRIIILQAHRLASKGAGPEDFGMGIGLATWDRGLSMGRQAKLLIRTGRSIGMASPRLAPS